MFDRIKTALRNVRFTSPAERERAYLEDAVSIYDLERRQIEVERGLFRNGVAL